MRILCSSLRLILAQEASWNQMMMMMTTLNLSVCSELWPIAPYPTIKHITFTKRHYAYDNWLHNSITHWSDCQYHMHFILFYSYTCTSLWNSTDWKIKHNTAVKCGKVKHSNISLQQLQTFTIFFACRAAFSFFDLSDALWEFSEAVTDSAVTDSEFFSTVLSSLVVVVVVVVADVVVVVVVVDCVCSADTVSVCSSALASVGTGWYDWVS